jgi:hypothetical protein
MRSTSRATISPFNQCAALKGKILVGGDDAGSDEGDVKNY